MVRFYTLIFATLASVYALSPEASSKLKSELAAGNIIPKILKEFEPKIELRVQFDNLVLENGMEITSTQASNAPIVSFERLSDDKEYTVIMFDANTRLYHWIVTNIHEVEKEGTSASVQVPYKETIPSHNYVFAVFEQAEKDQFLTVSDYFDMSELADTNRLQLASAMYMKQKENVELKKRAKEENTQFGRLIDSFTNNLRGILKEYGIEIGVQSVSNYDYEQGRAFASSFEAVRSVLAERQRLNSNIAFSPLYDQGVEFASSFKAVKSVLNEKQKNNNDQHLATAPIHAAGLFPNSGAQINNQFVDQDEFESIRSIEGAINKIARTFQNHASSTHAYPAQTAVPSIRAKLPQNNKNVDPWFIDDILDVVEGILSLHKKINDRLNGNRQPQVSEEQDAAAINEIA
ncbi:hypothetical protein G6F51_009779 [Rhizopus arrhizus]|uniref:WH1 domain-containing protein n=2 Tax=Rhizopus TaxID=4842 RepID=A0A9P6Y373_RHIOR|nr:hypothetical protein G6F51_009779 [Rhizopus arrhizus]